MNDITTFHYGAADLDVRTTTRDGELWFVAADVCRGLGLNHTHKALLALDDDERGSTIVPTPSGNQELSVISEPGLYKLIARSRKPAADWRR